MEEMAQPKQLKPVVKVLGMRAELTMQEVLLEHLEFLANIWELFGNQLEETRRIQKAVLVIRFMVDETEQMSWMKEGSGNRNDGARGV